jgi:hypothetical protein
MKKLALKLDALHVESFEITSGGVEIRGTVEARYDPESSGETDNLSRISCGGTCQLSVCFGDSCNITCDTCFGTCYACHSV